MIDEQIAIQTNRDKYIYFSMLLQISKNNYQDGFYLYNHHSIEYIAIRK
jgi:hypothetical protein